MSPGIQEHVAKHREKSRNTCTKQYTICILYNQILRTYSQLLVLVLTPGGRPKLITIFFFSVMNKNINKNLHRQSQTKMAIRSPSGTIPTYDEKKTRKTLATRGLEEPFFQLCCYVSFFVLAGNGFWFYMLLMYLCTGFSQNSLVQYEWIHSGYIYY